MEKYCLDGDGEDVVSAISFTRQLLLDCSQEQEHVTGFIQVHSL